MSKTHEETQYTTITTPKDDHAVVKLDQDEQPTTQDSDEATVKFSFFSMYRYADSYDKMLIAAGILSAINGAAYPLMAILFGDTVNAFVVPINHHLVNKDCFGVAAERQMKKLRRECLKHIMYQDMGWYDGRDASEIASRISGDSVMIKDGMGEKLGETIRYVCQFIAGYAIGFSRGWNLSLVMACVVPFMAVALTFLIFNLKISATRSQNLYATAGAVAEENLGAMRTVASLNGEARVIAKYNDNISNAEKETIRATKFVAIALGWFLIFTWLTYAVGLWYGGWLVTKQHSTISDPGSVFSAFYGILMGSISLPIATELFNILARQSQIDASSQDGDIPADCQGTIDARDLHFSYPSRPNDPILRGYSLTIHKGETVAFVGASGSGKSTLVALLERFYQPTSGAIYLDGRDISTLQLKWLRSQIGLVSQEPVLFATTVFENIAAGGDNITQDQVIAAAKRANAHDFIMGLPEGYDTMCGEKGASLSGGQKQRVAIARALVRQPKILVLDEATSALDNESERVVQEAINNLMAHTDMTTIVIAHRLSTIRTADKIAVISNGVVAELGRHDELMQVENGLYRSLVETQSGATSNDDNHHKALVHTEHVDAVLPTLKKSTAETDKPVDTATKPDFKMSRVYDVIQPHRSYFIVGLVVCSFQGLTVPAVSIIISKIIADMNLHYAAYVQSGKTDTAPLPALYDDVTRSAYDFIGVAIFFLAFGQSYCFRVLAAKLTTSLRFMHFQALMRQDIGYFDLHTTGALTTDLATLTTKVVLIAGENQGRLMQAVLTTLGGFFIAFFWGSWQLTLVMAAVFPLLLAGAYTHQKQYKDSAGPDALADSGSLATEAITNAKTVTAFGLQEDFVSRYDALLDKPLQEGSREAQWNGVIQGVAAFSTFAVYALIFWYGAHLLSDGTITFKQLINTLMAIMMTSQSVGQTMSTIGDVQDAKRAAAKIFSILDRAPPVDSSSNDGVEPTSVTGRIEFNDVSFNYLSRPDVKVLRHYDLTIEPGQTVAFCGPSGGGKSTCVALLERFYNPTSGSITLDGRDISTLNLHWLRSQIGLVGQEPVLFVGSIAENIASGISDSVPSTDLQERVEEAAKMANAHNFIMQFPDGYQTQVGLKGEQLSGGQKQRIAIARAIMKSPSILLLDEATSALDSESEKVVQEALDKLLAAKGRTTIVIAHRLSTIRNADKICVVSGGRIAEQGTHDELMTLNGIYTCLVQTSRS
ncbi:ABC transporter B member 10 [Aphanomyces cochlioides]|nr:ABC transporter B member 10 [Aphanomyces cochlioides]